MKLKLEIDIGDGLKSISRLIDVSRVTISALFNGKTKLDINMLIKVRYLTGLSFDAIIKEEIKLGLADNIFL